ncbi:MAG: hypothetical protein JWM21_4094 [Acidobacteria bacterium]|nr:hypothetical protein [Acidobacteriota bacterium]
MATLRSGWLTSGARVKRFEREFAEAVGAPHAVALNSCTAALHLAVEALGLKPGQGVLLPTMTFAATAEVVRYLGAVPILVDCDPISLNMNLDDAARKLSADYADYTETGSRKQKAEGRRQKAEGRKQRAEGRGQKAEGGGRTADGGGKEAGAAEVVGIMPVHVGGMMMDVAAVKEFATKHSLWVVEDAAHAFPAAWKNCELRIADCGLAAQGAKGDGQGAKGDEQGAKVEGERAKGMGGQQRQGIGARKSAISNQQSAISNPVWQRCGEGTADVSCFSFYANKTITTGEGGMAATGDADLAARMRLMSLHGLSQDAWERYSGGSSWDYRIVAPGFKYNLTDIAAAIGIHQLARAEEMRQEREGVARSYLEALADCEQIELPPKGASVIHAWHLFAIKLRLERLTISRDQFIEELKKAGVGCSVHWRPLHLHPYYQETFGWRPEDFPVATKVWERLISLPIFPGMISEEIEYVAEMMRGICEAHRR